jgi:F0F1-type ATP synthase epsilon subunit
MMNQGMKEYKISNFADLMQALMENPEWLEELRKMILTQELLEFPRKFENFRHRMEERFDTLEKQVQEVKKKADAIERKLDKDVWPLKGMWLEMKVKDNILSFFSEYLLDARAIDQEKINEDLSSAMEKGIISKEERVDALRLDLIIEGTLLNTGEPVLVAVEVSYTIDDFDVQRAINRARILEKALGKKVLPAVVGYKITKKAQNLMEKEGVLTVVFSE